MGTVLLDIAISLDGFIAGLNDEYQNQNDWFFASDHEGDKQVKDESITTIGAIIMGRRTYDLANQDDAFVDNPFRVPHFVLTHNTPKKLAKGDTEFIFVTDGIESALKQAQNKAGNQVIAIGGGANIAQQFLNAGLVDEIQLHIAPIIAGEGIRLFDNGNEAPLKLEKIRVINADDFIHVHYRVVTNRQ